MGQNYVVMRNSPDWKILAADYSSTGRYEPRDFLPSPLPPGFPPDAAGLIDLWNATFGIDYFACRATLKALTRESVMAADGPVFVTQDNLKNIFEQDNVTKDDYFVFTDDDDWMCDSLFASLRQIQSQNIAAVRWPSPIFNGTIINQSVENFAPRTRLKLLKRIERHPRMLALLRPMVRSRHRLPGFSSENCDFLFQTNNYALRGDLIAAEADPQQIFDHVDASRYFMGSTHKIMSLESAYLSVAHKHPCSITKLGQVARTSEPQINLVAGVRTFVTNSRSMPALPPGLSWVTSYVGQSAMLFENVLDSASL